MKKATTKAQGKTQAEQVLDYIKARGSITQANANSVLGISRLAAVIGKLEGQGYHFVHNRMPGFRASYTEYRFATPEEVALKAAGKKAA